MKKGWTWLVLVLAVAYPAALALLALLFHQVGERWWATATALYLPRIAFGAPLLPLVVALALLRRPILLAVQAISAALLAFPLMGLVLPHLGRARGNGPTIRVFSVNANAGAAGVDVLLQSVDRYAADVVLMQEIVLSPGDPLFRGLEARYPNVIADGQFVVATRFPLSAIDDPDRVDYGGRMRSPRYIRFVVASPLGPFALYEMHPVSPREDFYSLRGQGLRRELLSGRFFAGTSAPVVQANSGLRAAQVESVAAASAKETLPVIIAGDTNLPGLSPLLALLGEGRQDGFSQAGSGFGYTFPSARPWMRIDRMFASAGLRFVTFQVGCRGASDHLCIVAELQAE